MNIAYINEDFMSGDAFFCESDKRSYFYDDMTYIPSTILQPIIYSDLESEYCIALDFINIGNFIVTSDVAKMIMSFDPYGVEVYPAKLTFSGMNILDKRYIIAVDNTVDVLDKEKCIKITSATNRFYLSEEKIMALPPSKRIIFQPEGMLQIFFDEEVFNGLLTLKEKGKINSSIVAYVFDILDEAPCM